MGCSVPFIVKILGQVEKGRVWIKGITSQSVRTGLIVVLSSHAKAIFEKYDREVDEDDDDDDQVEVEELRSPVEWQAGLTVEAGGRETVVTGNVGQDLTAVSGGVEQGDHQGDQGWDTLHTTAVTR